MGQICGPDSRSPPSAPLICTFTYIGINRQFYYFTNYFTIEFSVLIPRTILRYTITQTYSHSMPKTMGLVRAHLKHNETHNTSTLQPPPFPRTAAAASLLLLHVLLPRNCNRATAPPIVQPFPSITPPANTSTHDRQLITRRVAPLSCKKRAGSGGTSCCDSVAAN